jgi:lysophospholipase L1-like esterase
VIVLVVFCGFDLVAGTLVARARRSALDDYAASERLYRTRSREYHHGLKPSTALDDARWGPGFYKVRTNSLGFRDREVREVPLTTDRWRILFIGDSFTEGVGVDYEKTFPALVEDALRAKDPRVEVLNAAVASYWPAAYFAKIRYFLEKGLVLNEVVVCIDVSDADDEVTISFDPFSPPSGELPAPSLSPPSAAAPSLAVFLHDHTLVTFQVLKRAKDLVSPPLPEEVIPPRGLWTVDEAAYRTVGAPGNERAVKHMDALAKLLEARGIPLTIVVYPWPAQIYYHDLDSKHVRLWREWSKRAGARFIDLFPLFVTDDPPLETIRRHFFVGDVHWNESGHGVVARGILEGRRW